MSERVMVIGGGGHAKVIIDALLCCGEQVIGILDDYLPVGAQVLGISVLGPIADYTHYPDCNFIIAIGDNYVRRRIAEKISVKWYTLIHPTAFISRFAQIGEGSVVMPNACINACAMVGKHCIVNTGAIVEHENIIHNYAHLSPNAALSGAVTIGECTHIGIGAIVRNNIFITDKCTIGAGAVVVKDIIESGIYVGVPAKILK